MPTPSRASCLTITLPLRITLPLSLPGLTTAGIFAFLLSWTDYTYAFTMASTDRLTTVPLGLATMMGSYDLRWGEK